MTDLVIGSVWAGMSARGYIHVVPAPAPAPRARNAFAALAESDEEASVPSVTHAKRVTVAPVAPARAPVPATAAEMLSAMSSGTGAWGELLVTDSEVAERVAAATWYTCEDGGVVGFDPAVAERAAAARAAVVAEEEAADTARQETDLFAQPFASNLDWSFADIYNTTRLTDEEWVACMTWLYDQGWDIVDENRAGFKGWPANLPPRVWVPETRGAWVSGATETRQWSSQAAGGAGRSVTQGPRAAGPRSAGAPVPRFCRDSCGGVPCASAACRYVHADTIACVDKCCGFDGRCSGDKRLTCIYMHPSEGQTWSAGMVVHRPATAIAPSGAPVGQPTCGAAASAGATAPAAAAAPATAPAAPEPAEESMVLIPAGADDNWVYMLGDGAAGHGYYLSGASRGDQVWQLRDGAFHLIEAC